MSWQHKEIQDSWVEPKGEIPAINKDDVSSWAPLYSGGLVIEDPGRGNSWKHVFGVLLDNYFLLLETKTRKMGKTQSSHVIKPIPLECLRLGHAVDTPEGQEGVLSMFTSIRSGSRPPTQYKHPFTIHHAYSKKTYTFYTDFPSTQNEWTRVLWSAITARKDKIGDSLYTSQVLDEGFFCMSMDVPPLTHGADITGRAICVAEFSSQGEHHLAVGCANGIYLRNRDRVSDSPFRSVLKINKPTSIAAFPEFNEFLVHYESALYSYPLDLIFRVSRGDSTPETLDESKEKLAEGYGDILFFKAGCVSDRTSIVYAAKNSKQVTTLHVLELIHHWQNGNRPTLAGRASYRPLGSPMPISEEPHDATFFLSKVAICTSKAIYIVEPMNTYPSIKVVPEFLNSKSGKKSFLGGLNGTLSKANALLSLRKRKSDLDIVKLDKNAKVLGLVIYGSNTLIVYDALGCFIDKVGKPVGSHYYSPWECTAGAYAHRGPHLLLFSSEIIEVRSVDTGKFIQIVEISHLRPLRCGSSERGVLVAAMSNGAEGDDDHTEKLVEVAYNGK